MLRECLRFYQMAMNISVEVRSEEVVRNDAGRMRQTGQVADLSDTVRFINMKLVVIRVDGI